MKSITEHMLRGVSAPTISTGSLSFFSGVGTSILAWFGSNAATIGAMCTVVSLFFMIFFGFANGRKLDKSSDNSDRLDSVDDHICEIKELIKSKNSSKKSKKRKIN